MTLLLRGAAKQGQADFHLGLFAFWKWSADGNKDFIYPASFAVAVALIILSVMS